jgi:ribosomal protein L29
MSTWSLVVQPDGGFVVNGVVVPAREWIAGSSFTICKDQIFINDQRRPEYERSKNASWSFRTPRASDNSPAQTQDTSRARRAIARANTISKNEKTPGINTQNDQPATVSPESTISPITLWVVGLVTSFAAFHVLTQYSPSLNDGMLISLWLLGIMVQIAGIDLIVMKSWRGGFATDNWIYGFTGVVMMLITILFVYGSSLNFIATRISLNLNYLSSLLD